MSWMDGWIIILSINQTQFETRRSCVRACQGSSSHAQRTRTRTRAYYYAGRGAQTAMEDREYKMARVLLAQTHDDRLNDGCELQ